MSTNVPLLNLKPQYEAIRDEVDAAIRRVVESQQFILGSEVEALEREIAEYCGVRHAVGCSSGTDALLLSLMALDIGQGDEVVTTPYTFFSTVSSIVRVGARPVLADIEPESYNIDPDQIERHVTGRTKAVIVVHLFGRPADMDRIWKIAQRYGLNLIEDACQALGAEYHGRRAGSLGDLAAFSFFPSKNLGGFGDGGMVTTNSGELAAKLRRLRVHGMERKYYHEEVGINGRLDALQAAVLRVKLRHLDDWTAGRQSNARHYRHLFRRPGLQQLVRCPVEPQGLRHVFNQFVIRVPAEHRDRLRNHMSEQGIGTEIYYPVPLHLQPCFKELGYRPGCFPESERAAAETIALPVFPELTEAQRDAVVASIADYFAKAGLLKPAA